MNDKHRQALKDALQRKKEKLPAHAGFTHFDSFPDNALVRQPVVLALTGMSRATIWRRIRAQKFPAAIPIGPNMVAWRVGDIRSWLESLSPKAA